MTCTRFSNKDQRVKNILSACFMVMTLIVSGTALAATQSQINSSAAKVKTIKNNLSSTEAAIKQQEKAKNNQLGDSLLDQVPTSMSPLKRAYKLQATVAKKGFDWQQVEKVIEKLEEELQELRVEVEQSAPLEKVADELGDLMFCCVNLARHYKLDAEMVMLQANRKFEHRFRLLEKALLQQGVSLDQATLEQMEAEWQNAKQ